MAVLDIGGEDLGARVVASLRPQAAGPGSAACDLHGGQSLSAFYRFCRQNLPGRR